MNYPIWPCNYPEQKVITKIEEPKKKKKYYIPEDTVQSFYASNYITKVNKKLYGFMPEYLPPMKIPFYNYNTNVNKKIFKKIKDHISVGEYINNNVSETDIPIYDPGSTIFLPDPEYYKLQQDKEDYKEAWQQTWKQPIDDIIF